MADFEMLEDVMGRLPQTRRIKIENRAENLSLAMEASRLKGKDVTSFGRHLKTAGARLVAIMPDGKEVDLPLPGVHA